MAAYIGPERPYEDIDKKAKICVFGSVLMTALAGKARTSEKSNDGVDILFLEKQGIKRPLNWEV